jgi:hypothetical protein
MAYRRCRRRTLCGAPYVIRVRRDLCKRMRCRGEGARLIGAGADAAVFTTGRTPRAGHKTRGELRMELQIWYESFTNLVSWGLTGGAAAVRRPSQVHVPRPAAGVL